MPEPANGGPPRPPQADRLPPILIPDSGMDAAEDAAALKRIVLILVLCGAAGFALLIASIVADWQ